ncbi:MAG: KH domain-containing protein, partial [Gemmatimonadetes bacterium]|nr:KH domain-containing protein [Gemmatimonadota bacterium]
MNSVVAEGRTYEEAVEHAIQKLGVRIDQVEVDVMEEKRGMLFGLFGGKVKVRVTHQSSTEDRIDEILSGIMKHMAIPSQVEVAKRGPDYLVNIGTVDSDGLLIGKRGETLHALEHLVNRIVHKDPTERGRITVDVSGYRARRDDQLKTQAAGMAKKVRETGREMSTDPLYSPDRRVIHLALTDADGIRTYTVGDGLAQAVVVAPQGSGGGPSRGGRGGRGRGGRGRGRGRGQGGGRPKENRE